jgi:hypothetical protein
MSCENTVGVKNILMTFKNCDTDEVVGPISHELSTEDIPTWKLCPFTNDSLPGGYTKRTTSDARCNIKVIRDRRVGLSMYQGCASITLQVEMQDGLVYTGLNGNVIGDNQSDSHEVEMDIIFRTVDELLPPGALLAA